MTGTPSPACLTADLVASRESADRARDQARLEAALAEVNRELGQTLLVPFSITLGDEWQGLLAGPAAALEADLRFRRLLFPLAVAAGIGVGPLSTPPRERTALMDGACFHRAREALDRAKARRGPATVLRSGDPLLDGPANALCLLLQALDSRWTARQREALDAYLTHGTEAAAARALGVTQPTLHQSLDRSQAKVYLEAREALLAFAAAYPLGLPEGRA